MAIDKDSTIKTADYQVMLKKMARLEEENEILEKTWPFSQRSNNHIPVYY